MGSAYKTEVSYHYKTTVTKVTQEKDHIVVYARVNHGVGKDVFTQRNVVDHWDWAIHELSYRGDSKCGAVLQKITDCTFGRSS
jgi:hypothetical protein